MADLRDMATRLGFADERTLLASGNLVVMTDRPEAEVEQVLEQALAAHGLATDVVVRDQPALAAAIAANPFAEEAAHHPSHLLVTFLREPFPAEALARAAVLHQGPERMQAIGRELYIDHVGREEMRQSMLVAVMRKARFPQVATARNWNTVVKLEQMLRG